MSSQIQALGEAVRRILATIPAGVMLEAAAKTRTLEEIEAVVAAGVTHIGYNYVQESLPIIQAINQRATWHMIGHVQRNKAKIVAQYYDMVETVDSWPLAQALERYCAEIGKVMPVLVEINSGREANKTGVLPEEVDSLVVQISRLKNLHLEGFMTMGPRFGEPEDSRPYFQATRKAFDRLAAANLPNVSMRYLSMGMSNSYLIAIQEGANIVRIGSMLFGERS